jgi:hypothetical protein
MATTLALSDGDWVVSGARGVFFDVRSEGPAVRLTALTGAAWRNTGDKLVPVTVYAHEGSGAGQEADKAAWRVVGAGVFQNRGKGTTRLALSSPVKVGPGKTVGLYVRASSGRCDRQRRVCISGSGTAGQVGASDAAITVLKGTWTERVKTFGGIGRDGEAYDGEYHALAGSVEYERDLGADLREAKRQTEEARNQLTAEKAKVKTADKMAIDARKKAAAAEKKGAAADAKVAQLLAILQPEVVDLNAPAVTPPPDASTSAAAASEVSESPPRANKRSAGMAGMVHETRARLTTVKKEKTDAERKADEAVSQEEKVPSPLVFALSLAWQSIGFHTFVPSLS